MTITSTLAFERVFREMYPKLFRTAFAILNDEEESKDVVNDIFAKLWRSRPEVDNIETYLSTSVRNAAINRSKHLQLHRVFLKEQTTAQGDGVSDSADEACMRHERLAAIRNFIYTQLPDRAREVLLLCYDEDKSYKEVAELLNISVASVSKHMVTALRMLRERFNNEQI